MPSTDEFISESLNCCPVSYHDTYPLAICGMGECLKKETFLFRNIRRVLGDLWPLKCGGGHVVKNGSEFKLTVYNASSGK